ncbi:hypothetical protein IFT54_04210 [Sphingomonas sp. CFBP 13714]|uniref:hypothetical protein n=1 Tax=Sphingomonas sp. CFBP 13714 TaxID=2775308 RepID=UPI00177FDF4F|nr:hypothetical protein [Sphingomonas sp. CFBP 13714]MBD8699016.1 hypothetical protein [Sphingomonas sp. CFBP 13714]
MSQMQDWRSIVTVQAIGRPETKVMFRQERVDPDASPIDVFIRNTVAINMLYIGHVRDGITMAPELGSLVLLGYMSAVESYFRAVLRGAIHIDPKAQKAVEAMQVTYGAALHHSRELLPEALFEGVSFAGRKGAIGFVRDVLGLSGNLPATVESALDPFLSICEIRHCCVHRFGKLGSQNAIKLGLGDHSTLIEQPFEPTLDHLQEIADALLTFSKTINNWLWTELLRRTVRKTPRDTGVIEWSWFWEDDAQAFREYHGLFASTLDSPPSPSDEVAYTAFAREFGPPGAPFFQLAEDNIAD